MTSSVTVRRANASDADQLASLGARTFVQAFGADNTADDVAAHLAATFSPDKQAAEIADPATIMLVAEAGEVLVGYVLLRWGAPPPSVAGSRPIELARIYVLGEWQSQRVGGALMKLCLAEARAGGADAIWLSVWQPNTRAQAFYVRWGFEIVGSKTFVLGSDAQTDWVMARDLAVGSDS